MTAGRKPGGVSFRVVEGGQGLHRQPLVPHQPTGRGLGFAIMLSLTLWALAILAALHLIARFLP